MHSMTRYFVVCNKIVYILTVSRTAEHVIAGSGFERVVNVVTRSSRRALRKSGRVSKLSREFYQRNVAFIT